METHGSKDKNQHLWLQNEPSRTQSHLEGNKDDVAQKLGNGYYAGQVYCFGYGFLKNPIPIAEVDKNDITGLNVEGSGLILECFAERFPESLHDAVVKAAAKYSK